ncbi:MAG TPA: hypothetical protein VNV66_03605 [Pilimelia sp.]|nr:hypothetical protein [Pilimelia sp.]
MRSTLRTQVVRLVLGAALLAPALAAGAAPAGAAPGGGAGPAAGAAVTAPPTAPAAAVACPARTTKKMCTLYRAAYRAGTKGKYRWDSVGCYRADRLPFHPQGRACDLVYGRIGKLATGDNRTDGDKMRSWLVKNRKKYNLDHVMWRGRIYSARTNWSSKGRPQPGCANWKRKITTCHYDHVHVAVVR